MPNPRLNYEQKKVLFTGNGNHSINDLIKRMPHAYVAERCAPTAQGLQEALESFDPTILILCLSYETPDTLGVLSVLQDRRDYRNLPVIAVGSEEDCEVFRRIVTHKNRELFEQPLDVSTFLETLSDLLEMRLMELSQMVGVPVGLPKPAPAPAPAAAPAPAQEAGTDWDIQDWESAPRLNDRREKPKEADFSDYNENEQALMRKIQRSIFERGRQTILVVDDDVRMLNVIKVCLQDLYDVIVVPSGKLALKYLSKRKADLVLLDYMMPDEDGPEVLRQIRTSSLQPDTPVLFLTGVADKDLVMRGLEYRPNGYLLKPVKRETLLEKATEIILGL